VCAQFLLRARWEDLERTYGVLRPESTGEGLDERVLPTRRAPVILLDNGQRVLRSMSFSLIPAWSKVRRPKFATHNARLDTIDTKPTWREPFAGRHALVPMIAFVEPIYEGRFAGNMVQFCARQGELLTAAAVYDRWVDPESKEVVDSFAIITDDPPAFVRDAGHDRCPIFLADSAFGEWLDARARPPGEWKIFLRARAAAADFAARVDRPLKARKG
jgi:putative SOS response-associated peptidase YedK